MIQCIFLLTLIIAWSYNDGNFHSLWHMLGLCDSAFWYIFPLSSNTFFFTQMPDVCTISFSVALK
jgi:hypothetical protein